MAEATKKLVVDLPVDTYDEMKDLAESLGITKKECITQLIDAAYVKAVKDGGIT